MQRLPVIAAYCGMCLIWGTTWLAIKIGLHTLGPLTGVGLRFVIAALFLFAIAAVSGALRPLREIPWKLVAVFATTLFGLNYILTYAAETRLDSGLVSVLFGTLPFFTFGFGHVMVHERTTPRIWIGASIAFAGVAVISLAGQVQGSPLFALCAIAAAGVSAFANVYAKRHSHHDPLLTLPPSMFIAGAVILVAGLIFERTDWSAVTTAPSLAALLYLAIFGSGIAFFLNLWVLHRLPVWIVGMSSLIFPVIAITVGILFGGEQFGTRELAGSLLVIAGMAIALSAPQQTDNVPQT
ncbi:MAG: EamA family transporter [Candidatus Eremiobacteraeota bacterium]|nr:EamA family transporter [Candidatus Eremiobacteraeota bacterium]